MQPPEQDFTPRNMKGIDLNEFAIHLGSNKIMLIPKSKNGSHYTVHVDVRPGVVDLHETWNDIDGSKQHRTLFAMKKSDLGPLLTDIGHSAVQRLRGLIRKLRIGWMSHRSIGLLIGLFPTEQDLMARAKLSKRKRLVLDERALLSNVRTPEFLEEIFNEPDGVYTLVSVKRGNPKQIGFAYKVTLPTGEPRLFWVKKSELLTVMQRLQDQLVQSANRFAIPPKDYSKYGL